MSKRKSGKTPILISDRAIRDILAIEEYSIETWGKRVANRYLADLEAALERLAEHPAILREEPELHIALRFYRVNKHLLVCDIQDDAIFVLTVLHSSTDIPGRLSELEPTIQFEVELLHQKLQQAKKSRR